MEWNALLKDVGGRFKHRSWLLIDLAPEALVLSVVLPNTFSSWPISCGWRDNKAMA